MSKDLELIANLEKKLGEKLKRRSIDTIKGYFTNGFALNEKKDVVGINLNECNICRCLEMVSKFRNLKLLKLIKTDLTDISHLKNLKNLERLSLYNNKVTDITPLQGLLQLKELNLGRNRLTDISPLKELINLTVLNLNINKLSDIRPLRHLSNLQELYLSRNQLMDISPLQDLNNLKNLELDRNQLKELTPLRSLLNLQKLNLHFNQLTDISPLRELHNLKVLNLYRNQLTDVSPLQELINLSTLNLDRNQLTDISALKDLKKLEVLSLINNQVKEIPDSLLDLEMDIDTESDFTLEDGFFLKGNPLENPPLEIAKEGLSAIRAYSESLEASAKLPLNEVKVILVGDGGAGKTSLAKRLRGKRFNKRESQTHGIDINHIWIRRGESKIKVHIWDFGGQEIMHATHQFFLSKRSLYILVLDGRKDEKTEYWLKHIRSFGGDSPVLVVLNKIDENPTFELNRLFLQEKYKNIKGFFRVSCARDIGLKEFFSALSEALTSVGILQTTWPENWFNVKKRLENMKEHFIDYGKYHRICAEEKVVEAKHRDILLDFLNDLGIILHFNEHQLEDTHILEPRWVTEAVYKIINSGKLSNNKGILELKFLAEILKQRKMRDYYYPKGKFNYIIELMKKFELCFEIDNQKELIPDLLEVQEKTFDFDYHGALRFILEYDFLPRSVMPRFIVRMNNDIKDRCTWRTGVFLESRSFRARAVVKADLEEKRIAVYVTGEQRKDYFSVIRHTIRDINESFESLQVDEQVPMPDNPQITHSYEHLLWMDKSGIKDCIPEKAKRTYNVKELLGIVDMDEKKQSNSWLKYEFQKLVNIESRQKRGFDFETFLYRLLRHYDMKPRASFRNTGEQIDGSFQIGNDCFLLEAKWHCKPTPISDLMIFNEKIKSKVTGTRGLFLSISGFTREGLKGFGWGRSTALIGMDGSDLKYILDEKITLPEAVSLKLRHAADTNEVFAPLDLLKQRY